MKAKYTNSLILVFIATGTAFAAFIGDISRGAEPLQTAFLCFVAAIIAIQVIPALMLLGCMIKSLLVRSGKEIEN